MTIVFLDTETTSLRHDRRVWEIGLVIRNDEFLDHEYSWLIDAADLDLGNADLKSLQISGFHERHPHATDSPKPAPDTDDEYLEPYPESMVMRDLEHTFLRGATIVGAVPNFDTEVLANRMREHGICPSWHYHLVDVETFAAGALNQAPPWDFDQLLGAWGLAYDEADRHTALGDARMVRDLYDAVLGRTRKD